MMRRQRDAYMSAYREAHRVEAREYARAWRREHPEKAKASKRASYERNRDERIARMKEYAKANSGAAAARVAAWKIANPERALIHAAKVFISVATGTRFAHVPDDLAEAKAAQLSVVRAVKKRRASAMSARSDETQSGSVRQDASAVPTADANKSPDPKD